MMKEFGCSGSDHFKPCCSRRMSSWTLALRLCAELAHKFPRTPGKFSAVAHEPPNGAAGHNSIEQDVDMVQLPHREDAYERESPRAGEADFILAKHRNRPTANITVAFQGHYSRVVGKAQS